MNNLQISNAAWLMAIGAMALVVFFPSAFEKELTAEWSMAACKAETVHVRGFVQTRVNMGDWFLVSLADQNFFSILIPSRLAKNADVQKNTLLDVAGSPSCRPDGNWILARSVKRWNSSP